MNEDKLYKVTFTDVGFGDPKKVPESDELNAANITNLNNYLWTHKLATPKMRVLRVSYSSDDSIYDEGVDNNERKVFVDVELQLPMPEDRVDDYDPEELTSEELSICELAQEKLNPNLEMEGDWEIFEIDEIT